VSFNATDDIVFTYMSTAGNLGWRSNGEGGYSQSLVGTVGLSDSLEYVAQSDYVQTESSFYAIGYNNYLFYTLNDCWKAGGRLEWYKTDSFSADQSESFWEATLGVNYKPHANVVVRPEIRWDWTDAEGTAGVPNNYDETVFGIDAIFTF
jgi:hypothetical protein